MPAAPSAPAAAPASACLRVRRTLLSCRLDEHEPAEDPVEIAPHLAIVQGRSDVLADRVERALVLPGIQDMPLIRVLVDVVDGRRDPGRAHSTARIAEAWDLLPALGVGV